MNIEFRGCLCPGCGRRLKGWLPTEISSAPTSYGPRIAGYVASLSARHDLPYARLAEVLADLFGTRVSVGTNYNMLALAAQAFEPIVARIKSAIAGSRVVAADQTYVRQAGRKIVLWIWCTPRWLYLARGPNRASEVVKREWPDGFPSSIQTCDRLPAQLKTPSLNKQVCLHHMMRNRNDVEQSQGASPWIPELKEVIARILQAGAEGRRCYRKTYDFIEADLKELLDEKYLGLWLDDHERQMHSALQKVGSFMTTCLYHAEVPTHNDDAEQGSRGAKVQMNVSNQWRSAKDTGRYCIIRSVIGSAIRQKLKPLDVLTGEVHLS